VSVSILPSARSERRAGGAVGPTARSRTELAGLYRTFFESASIPFLAVDLDTLCVVVANASFERMLGYRPGELAGQPYSGLTHPDDGAADAAPAGAGDTFRLVKRYMLKDGDVIWGRETGSLVRDEHGRPIFSVCMAEDVSEELAAERALQGADDRYRGLEAQLIESQRLDSIGQLAGGIAHDFNNLMLGIRGYAELAIERLDRGEDNAKADIMDILSAAERATQLTGKLLAFGRRQVLQPCVLDLGEVVRDLERLVRQLSGDGIEFGAIYPDRPVLVDVDRTQLERVITNLAVNARDAMPDGGRLTIEVGLSDDTTEGVIKVIDNGCGMDVDTLNRIFEPFFSTKGVAGSGFGLATVHGIVSQSGGRILVESVPGEGTTFSILLPLSATTIPTLPMPDRAPAEGGGDTVLLVEDDAMVRTIVTSMLEGLGYRVLAVTCGADAVDLAVGGKAQIDLVLTDLAMPTMDGRATAQALRQVLPAIKVLYMSGYAHDVVIRGGGAFEPGTAFLQKPFGAHELAVRVRDVLDADSVA
jgi:two-component system cell cycle sensor histidine kinase/response regulator CckA